MEYSAWTRRARICRRICVENPRDWEWGWWATLQAPTFRFPRSFST
jgi:hypothetical protein